MCLFNNFPPYPKWYQNVEYKTEKIKSIKTASLYEFCALNIFIAEYKLHFHWKFSIRRANVPRRMWITTINDSLWNIKNHSSVATIHSGYTMIILPKTAIYNPLGMVSCSSIHFKCRNYFLTRTVFFAIAFGRNGVIYIEHNKTSASRIRLKISDILSSRWEKSY